MKNYQKLCYSHYYVQNTNGECTPISRKECFAPEAHTTNPFKQRWFYDPDAGYVIRLARTKAGDELGKRNATDLKGDERHQTRQLGCVGKNGVRCTVTCDRCPLNEACVSKHKATNGKGCHKKCEVCNLSVSRIFELDRPLCNDEDSSGSGYDLHDDIDTAKIAEDRELLTILFSVLDNLSTQDRELWDCLKDKLKKQEIADKFHITVDGVRYREQRLFKIMRSDRALKSFFEKN